MQHQDQLYAFFKEKTINYLLCFQREKWVGKGRCAWYNCIMYECVYKCCGMCANVHVCKGHRGTSGVYQSSLQRFLWDKVSHQNLELIFVLVWLAIKPTVSIFSLPITGVYRTMWSKPGFLSVRKIWTEVAYLYKSVLFHWDISQSFHLLIF